MTTTVQDKMTTNLITLERDAPVIEAARRMRDSAIGDVLVTEKGRLVGIATDRDLVVRCLATGGDPEKTDLGSVCSEQLATLNVDDEIPRAVQLMEERAVRRLPVIDAEGRPVGIVSIGDLAQDRDRESR